MEIQPLLQQRAARMAPHIEPPTATIDAAGHMHLQHEMLRNTHYASPGIVDALERDGTPTQAALAAYDDALRDVVRREGRRGVFERIDQEIERARPWRILERPPAWATLTHPLFAYALHMNGANDLDGEALANGSSPTPGVRIRCVQDLLIGRAMLDPAHPAAGKVGCDTAGATLTLMADILETTRHLLRGRALAALIQLRGCGDAHLDGIVASLPILQVVPSDGEEPVITIQLAPVPWVAPVEAPRGIDVSSLRRNPPCL